MRLLIVATAAARVATVATSETVVATVRQAAVEYAGIENS